MDSSLAKDRILRGRGAFADVMASGAPSTAGSVKLFLALADPPHPLKIGFAVTRSAGNAVVRNRIKRCLREAFRRSQHRPRSGKAVLLYTGRTPWRSCKVDCVEIQKDVQAVLDKLSGKE